MKFRPAKFFFQIFPAIGLITLVGCDQKKSDVGAKAPETTTPASQTDGAAKPGLSSSLGSSETAPPAPEGVKPVAPTEPTPEEAAKMVAALQEIDSTLRDKALPPAEAGMKMAKLASDSSVPLSSRTDALQHAMNLLPDQGFTSLDGMLKDKETPVSLLDMVFTEVHNRPPTTQLPVALTLLRSSNPDVASRARSLLAFHLDRDYGDDLAAWDAPVAEALAKLSELAK